MIIEYSKKNRIAQDKYYTGKSNADNSFALLNKWIKKLDLFPTIIEPAAGDGKLMDSVIGYEVIGYDLFPEREDITKNDFLENSNIFEGECVTFMNPPFGSRGKLCKEFISKSLEGSELVGCIVPNSFIKVKKNVVNKEYDILDYILLDSKDFTILEKEYEVNCYFLIISKPQKKYKVVSEIVIEEFTPPTEMPIDIDFKNKLKDSVVFDIKRNIEEYLKTGKYINHLKNFDLTKQELSLDSVEWDEFIVEDLFIVEKGKQLTKETIISGEIPYITCANTNNGVGNYVSNEMKLYRDALTIAESGEPGVCFYHDYIFCAGGNTNVLKLKSGELNKFLGVFLATVFEKLKPKYSYGKTLGQTRLKVEKIHLPVKNSEPDYEFMERYIKSLNFSECIKNK